VRVKPLEWRHFDNGNAWANTEVGLAYYVYPDGSWSYRNGNPQPGGTSIDAAKAAAQADYEARILSALASDASPRGEAVAWQTQGEDGQWFDARGMHVTLHQRGFPVRPLYAHPAPATVTDAMVLAAWRGFYGCGGRPEKDEEEMMRNALAAALAPATEVPK